MSNYDQFRACTPAQRRRAIEWLCWQALTVWEAFLSEQEPLRYHDSVVGMQHRVDAVLPREALRYLQQGGADHIRADLNYRYLEPITALQDGDLELPMPIEYSYYAIYNLFQKYAEQRSIDDWLIANQALASMGDPDQVPSHLAAALAYALRDDQA
ncbi:MAG: hypothetical protein Fur005_26420 [Roseiflexaceae bacterium]